jgi:hypothetical protein
MFFIFWQWLSVVLFERPVRMAISPALTGKISFNGISLQ